jgi:hypothetical protein
MATTELTIQAFPSFTLQCKWHAEELAKFCKGKLYYMDREHEYKIVDTRIEYDPEDTFKGRIVGICELIEKPVAPKQTANKITGSLTGQDVAECIGLTWENLGSLSWTMYAEIAEKITAQYLAPLQGLVQDWQQLAEDSLTLENAAQHDFWTMRYEELIKQSKRA